MRAWILHPHDPCVDHASGVSTMIKTFVACAPDDLELRLVGISVDPEAHPLDVWHTVEVGGRPLAFLPIVAAHPSVRSRVPLSLKYTRRLARWRDRLGLEQDCLLFHRLEPAWATTRLPNPQLMFLHYHPEDQILGRGSEVTWRRFPWLYFWLEKRLLPRVAHLWSERADAIAWWQERYPELRGRAAFLPTWADDAVFHVLPAAQRELLRRELCAAAGLDPAAPLAFFAGRFEAQKDPMLLMQAWQALGARRPDAQLVLAGEGSFGQEMRDFARAGGFAARLHFAGALPARAVASWLNAADVFVMSSAFEGMPLAMIEALACGVPVASTRTGESPRLVQRPQHGLLIDSREPAALAAAIDEVLGRPRDREACVASARPYTPRQVLAPVYEFLRNAAAGTGSRA